MIRKIFLGIAVGMLLSASAHADCYEACTAAVGCPDSAQSLLCRNEKAKCEKACEEVNDREPYDEEDVLFTGTKIKNGNTTIMQGERIAAPLSAFQGGDLRPEDLAPFRKSIASSTNGSGSVSVSSSSSQQGWLFGRSKTETQTTTVPAGVTVTHADS